MCIFGNTQEEKDSCNKAKSVKRAINREQMEYGTDAGKNPETDEHTARGGKIKSILKKGEKGKI